MLVSFAIAELQKLPADSEIIAQWFSKTHAEFNAGLENSELTEELWQEVVAESDDALVPIWHDAASTITTLVKREHI